MIDQSEPALPRILSLMDDFPIIPGPLGSAGTGRRMLRYPDASKRAASRVLPASVHEPHTFFIDYYYFYVCSKRYTACF